MEELRAPQPTQHFQSITPMPLDPADHVLLFLASHPAAHLKKKVADKLDHPLLKLVGADHGVLDQNATISIDNNHVVTVKTTGPATPQTFTSSSFTEWSSTYRTFPPETSKLTLSIEIICSS